MCGHLLLGARAHTPTPELLISPLHAAYGAAVHWAPHPVSIKGSEWKGQLTSLICPMSVKAKTVLIRQPWSVEPFLAGGGRFSAGSTQTQKLGCAQSGQLSRTLFRTNANANWTQVLVLRIVTRLVRKNNSHWVKRREESIAGLQWWALTTKKQTRGCLIWQACVLS